MENIRKIIFLLLSTSLVVANAMGQCRQVKWPENRQLAEEKIALYGDALKQGHYQATVKPLQWMLANAPGWHIKMYIDAAKIYDKLAKVEKDPEKKKKLVDTLLWVYDERIRECGEKTKVLNRKIFSAYKYRINNKSDVETLLAMYDTLFNISGGNIAGGNLVACMTTVKANKVLLNTLDDAAIMERYDKIMAVLNNNINTAQAAGDEKKTKKYNRYKEVIDGLLVSMVKVDCDFVKKNLEPKFRKDPSNVALAKKIFGFMLQGKCTNDPLWLAAGEAILKEEKDFGLIKNIALKYCKNKVFEKAEPMFKEALQIAKSPTEKADILIYLGSIAVEKGQKTYARQYFREASSTSNTEKRGYEKIGDLYYGSFNECSKKESMAQDRLVYIAAYNMYKRAGSAKKMARSKSQFPSKEDIFLLNWKAGQTGKVGCWIGETVQLATRD